MREWIFGGIGLLIGLVGGFAGGYFVRKGSEIEIEEVTEEELNELAGIKQEEPVEEIGTATVAESHIEPAKDIQKEMDTQKTKYWNMWKDGKDGYMKQSELKEGEDPVISEEEDFDIPDDGIESDEKDEQIELSSEEEYNYWKSFRDGEYETSDITWFSGDDVTLDDDTLPIVNPQRHLGFLPKDIFKDHPKEGEIFVKNNFYKIVFCVSRVNQTYDTKTHEEEYGGDDE